MLQWQSLGGIREKKDSFYKTDYRTAHSKTEEYGTHIRKIINGSICEND